MDDELYSGWNSIKVVGPKRIFERLAYRCLVPLKGVLFLELMRRLGQLGAVTASGQGVVSLPTLPCPPLLPSGGQAVKAALLVDEWPGGFSLPAAPLLSSPRLKHSRIPTVHGCEICLSLYLLRMS